MAQKDMTQATTVLGGPVRFSYAHVFEPTSMEPDGKKKYSISFIIPKSNKDLVSALKRAIEAAKEAGKAKWGGKIPANLKLPLRDGDVERADDPTYAKSYFINASSSQRPGVVDSARMPLTSEEDFYSGCFGRFHVNFYPFNTAGNKGIACGLNHLQKTKDGDRLSGRVALEDAFDDEYQETFDDDDDENMMG